MAHMLVVSTMQEAHVLIIIGLSLVAAAAQTCAVATAVVVPLPLRRVQSLAYYLQ
jgi:hypothetical protein